jgi:hypothetical protein
MYNSLTQHNVNLTTQSLNTHINTHIKRCGATSDRIGPPQTTVNAFPNPSHHARTKQWLLQWRRHSLLTRHSCWRARRCGRRMKQLWCVPPCRHHHQMPVKRQRNGGCPSNVGPDENKVPAGDGTHMTTQECPCAIIRTTILAIALVVIPTLYASAGRTTAHTVADRACAFVGACTPSDAYRRIGTQRTAVST